MKIKTYTDERGRKITTYDDILSLEYRQRAYDFAIKSKFTIGWADSAILENQQHKFLHSEFSPDDLARLELVDELMKTPAAEEFEGYQIQKCILNLSTPADANFYHAHAEDKIILYYVNLEWKDGWHGETLFFDETLRNIFLATPYTPGRVTVFDAKIPHSIRPQSHLASFYRFTLATVLVKQK
jgi:hypothetical protein